jgi:hypothetical protein
MNPAKGTSRLPAAHAISGGREGKMEEAPADLPELSGSAKRKLAIKWDALLDRYGLTAAHVDRYANANDRIRKYAISKAPDARSRWFDTWFREYEHARQESGISPSVAVAKGRFTDFTSEYWLLWESGSAGYEKYADQLKVLKRKVLTELASIWKGRSESASLWYEKACAPAIDQALAAVMRERISRARGVELLRLQRLPVTGEMKTGALIPHEICPDGKNLEAITRLMENGGDNLSPEAQEAVRVSIDRPPQTGNVSDPRKQGNAMTDMPESDPPTAHDDSGISTDPLNLDNEIEALRANVPVQDALSPETMPPMTDKAEASVGAYACPEDPSPQNPAPVAHPAHRIWEDATRAAELDLARFKHKLEGMRSDVLQSIEKMVPRFQKELLTGHSETYESFKFKCAQFWEAWHVLYLVGIFHIWAERALSMVWDHKGARYHEEWLASYSTSMEETAKRVSLADERLDPRSFIQKVKYQLSRECIYGNLRAREKVAAIQRGAAEPVQQKSGDALAPGQLKPTEAEVDGGPTAPDSSDSTPRVGGGLGTESSADKGKIKILRGLDGKLKNTVTLDVASRFGGVSRRAIEKAVKKRTLLAEGDRLNRRILVHSLLKYFPPEDNAN